MLNPLAAYAVHNTGLQTQAPSPGRDRFRFFLLRKMKSFNVRSVFVLSVGGCKCRLMVMKMKGQECGKAGQTHEKGHCWVGAWTR